MAIQTGAASHEYSAINITPMIDVLLVLLIVFMAIAPQKPSGLDALVPRNPAATERAAPEDPVVLEIARDGVYKLNSRTLGASALRERLIEIYARRADSVLFVKAAPELEFGTVASAIDTARAARVERIALMPRASY